MIELAIFGPWIILCVSSLFSLNQIMGLKLMLDSILKTELLFAWTTDFRLRSTTSLTSSQISFWIEKAEQKIAERVSISLASESSRLKKDLLMLSSIENQTGRAFLNYLPKNNSLQLIYQACIPQGLSGWTGLGASAIHLLNLSDPKSPWLESGNRDCGGRFTDFASVPSWKIKSQAQIQTAIFLPKTNEGGSIAMLTLAVTLGLLLFSFGVVKSVLILQTKHQNSRHQIVCNFQVANKAANQLNEFVRFQKLLRLETPICPLSEQSNKGLQLQLSKIGWQNQALHESTRAFKRDSCGFYQVLLPTKSQIEDFAPNRCQDLPIRFRLRHPQEDQQNASFDPFWTSEVLP